MISIKTILQFCTAQSALAAKDVIQIKNFPKDIRTAGKIGYRLAKIDGKNKLETILVTGNSIMRKGVKPHIPGVFAGIGLITPAPLGSVVGFGLGKFLQRIV